MAGCSRIAIWSGEKNSDGGIKAPFDEVIVKLGIESSAIEIVNLNGVTRMDMLKLFVCVCVCDCPFVLQLQLDIYVTLRKARLIEKHRPSYLFTCTSALDNDRMLCQHDTR